MFITAAIMADPRTERWKQQATWTQDEAERGSGGMIGAGKPWYKSRLVNEEARWWDEQEIKEEAKAVPCLWSFAPARLRTLKSCSEHSDSHLYPKPWNREEMKLAAKLPCHNHRRTKGLTACRVYISYSNSSLSTLYVAAIVMARPPFILTCSSTIKASACAANVWSQTALHSCTKVSSDGPLISEWELQKGGGANISIASKEPRAMNLINNVIWELMLFMLRFGIWIVEIRVWC